MVGRVRTVVGGYSIVEADIFQAYQGVSQSQSSAADLTINWTQETKKDSGYTHSTSSNPEEITIVNAGWYRVTYTINWDSDYTTRICQRVRVTKDGSDVTPSMSHCYMRYCTYGRFGSNTATFIANVTAGQVLIVRSQQSTTMGFTQTRDVDTIADHTWILIEKIG